MTWQTFTWKIELELSGVGSGWTDVTNDVLLTAGDILVNDGMNSISLIDLLASPGDLQFVLDNSPANSGGKFGYYSPGHTNCRAGFVKKIRVRYSEYYNSTRYYFGIFWLQKPIPSAGIWGEAVTRCRATDWLEQMMNEPLPEVPVQTNKRGDELLTTLLTVVPVQPANTDFDTGDSTFPSAFDLDNVDRDSIYVILGKIARSEYGRIYLQPDASTGGVLTFEHRNARLGNITSLGTITDTMADAVPIDDAGQVYDRFQVQITQRTLDTSNIDIAALDYHLYLGPGEERTFTIPYIDPSSGKRISGFDIQNPTAVTDYKFGSTDDGTSSDLNANLAVTLASANRGANSATPTVKNNGGVGGYLNLFKLRGKGIYPYNTYTVKEGSGGLRVQTLDMPYQNDPNTADAVCKYLKTIASDNERRGLRLTVEANKSAALMAFAMTGVISTRWTIAETLTGISGDFFVNGRRRTVSLGNKLTVEALLSPAGSSNAWVLETSELDSTTVLTV